MIKKIIHNNINYINISKKSNRVALYILQNNTQFGYDIYRQVAC